MRRAIGVLSVLTLGLLSCSRTLSRDQLVGRYTLATAKSTIGLQLRPESYQINLLLQNGKTMEVKGVWEQLPIGGTTVQLYDAPLLDLRSGRLDETSPRGVWSLPAETRFGQVRLVVDDDAQIFFKKLD